MTTSTTRILTTLVVSAALLAPATARAEDAGASDLAKQLSNPVASLISVPLKVTWDEGFGAEQDGRRVGLNFQPVIPISLSEDWNLISRTIVPVLNQSDFVKGQDSVFGFGDTLQSLFFSPKAPTASGLIWGLGPVFALPTATDETLGSEQWSVGPNLLVLKQSGQWTVGFLGNHLWSVAGENDRSDVNATFLQPFVSYTTSNAVTMSLNTESTYDWTGESWTVPINFMTTKLVKIGKQPISVGGGIRYWADSPAGGADDFGLTFQMTFLFPK